MTYTEFMALAFFLAGAIFGQLVLGLFLAGVFLTDLEMVFINIIGLMDGPKAALARGLHSIMTSLIFSSMYIHIMKPLILNMSWAKSNSVWAVGWIVLAIIIIVAFLGYVLPLTQISYWGLIVFVKIINSIPYIGSPIAKMLLGGEFISGLTFSRVATLHIALPFILLLLVLFHMVMLHWNNSSDPLGFGGGQKTGQLFFHWFGLRDMAGAIFIFTLSEFILLVFISIIAHEESFQYYSPLATPEKILPEWFFLPLFGIIKSISNQAFALLASAAAALNLVLCFFGRRLESKTYAFWWGCFVVLCWVGFGFWGGVVVLVWPLQPVLRAQLLALLCFLCL